MNRNTTNKLWLAGAVALVAAGLTAPAAPAYFVDPGAERLILPLTSTATNGATKPTKAEKPKPRPKQPLQP